jgi:Competence protein
MIIATNIKGERIRAIHGVIAFCPNCKESLIPKCGKINVHHFSHKGENDCDVWGEESDWHRSWKSLFPTNTQEKWIGEHRADIQLSTGRVIEFQASPIDTSTIEEREEFYKDMIWVLNGHDFDSNFELRKKGGYFTFRWKYPRSSWSYAQSPIFIDFSESPWFYYQAKEEGWYNREIFLIKKIYFSKYCGGWGIMMSKNDFLKTNGVSKIV